MKSSITCMLLILTSLAAMAAGISGKTTDVVVANAQPKTVAVTLVRPADFVSVPVNLLIQQKSRALSFEESMQATDQIAKKAEESGRFITSLHVVSLAQQHKSASSFGESAFTQAEIYLLVTIAKETNNIFTAGAEAARFMEKMNFSGKINYQLGKPQLAVDNPEQYRSTLLRELKKHVEETRSNLGLRATVKLKGLESPVMVRQLDDRNVELFLDYKLLVNESK